MTTGACERPRCAGLSPNDCREETGWPRPNDPTADSIEPPVAGGKPAGDAGVADELPTPAPPPSDDGKVAILSPRRPTS